MAFLARILRVILWMLFAVWAGRKLLGWLAPTKKGAPEERYPASPLAPRPLHRDPVCGTHVSAEIAYTLEQGGEVLHFCSAECRERYGASLRRAANG